MPHYVYINSIFRATLHKYKGNLDPLGRYEDASVIKQSYVDGLRSNNDRDLREFKRSARDLHSTSDLTRLENLSFGFKVTRGLLAEDVWEEAGAHHPHPPPRGLRPLLCPRLSEVWRLFEI